MSILDCHDRNHIDNGHGSAKNHLILKWMCVFFLIRSIIIFLWRQFRCLSTLETSPARLFQVIEYYYIQERYPVRVPYYHLLGTKESVQGSDDDSLSPPPSSRPALFGRSKRSATTKRNEVNAPTGAAMPKKCRRSSNKSPVISHYLPPDPESQ
eukprot:scaffold5323_cov173-Amphora_coffeaeformis.AAC.7